MKKIVFIILILFFSLSPAQAADRYWVGGGSDASWDATGDTNWGTASNTQDDASVPGSGDAVIFDGVGTGDSASTLDADITVASVDFTGYSNTLTHNSNTRLTVAGNFTFVSGMTYTRGSGFSSRIRITGTSSFTSGGKVFADININGVGITVTLQDALTGHGQATFSITNGKWDTNDQTVSTASFSSSNSNTRELDLGSTTFTLTADSALRWNISTSTNMTMTPGTSTIQFTAGNMDFNGGGLIYNNFTMTSATGASDMIGSNTFNTVTVSANNSTWNLTSGTTTTVTDLVMTGSSGSEMTLQAKTADSIATITKSGGGTVEEDYLDVIDVTGTPSDTWFFGTNGSGDNASGWSDVPGVAVRRIWIIN